MFPETPDYRNIQKHSAPPYIGRSFLCRCIRDQALVNVSGIYKFTQNLSNYIVACFEYIQPGQEVFEFLYCLFKPIKLYYMDILIIFKVFIMKIL